PIFLGNMDPVGNTIGLLRFVLNSFSQIQLAREFESEFERYQPKLDLIQLRLSRWGEIVKLNNNSNIASKDLATPVNRGEGLENPKGDPTTGILLEIRDTVAKAQRDARKIKSGTSSDQLLDAEVCLPADLRGLHTRFKGLLSKRTSQTVKVVEGLKWAFYKRDHFDRFIADISSLTDNLEGLLPEGDRQKLWELSSDECEGINKPNLEELKDIAQDCDPIIENASGEALRNARGGANNVTQTHNIGNVLGFNNGNFNLTPAELAENEHRRAVKAWNKFKPCGLLLEIKELEAWFNMQCQQSVLWISGCPTNPNISRSYMIEYIREKKIKRPSKPCHLLYYYIDRTVTGSSYRNLQQAFWQQAYPSDRVQVHVLNNQDREDSSILDVLVERLAAAHRDVYIIIDGLDQLPRRHSKDGGHLAVAISSQNTPSFDRGKEYDKVFDLRLRPSYMSSDIRNYLGNSSGDSTIFMGTKDLR
ncbi:hypothetical protein N5P37_007094, partial [Trichoderma harzianum]